MRKEGFEDGRTGMVLVLDRGDVDFFSILISVSFFFIIFPFPPGTAKSLGGKQKLSARAASLLKHP